MGERQRRPDGPPSAAARARLSGAVQREVDDLSSRLVDEMLAALVRGDVDDLARSVDRQERALRRFEHRVADAIAAATVERAAEEIVFEAETAAEPRNLTGALTWISLAAASIAAVAALWGGPGRTGTPTEVAGAATGSDPAAVRTTSRAVVSPAEDVLAGATRIHPWWTVRRERTWVEVPVAGVVTSTTTTQDRRPSSVLALLRDPGTLLALLREEGVTESEATSLRDVERLVLRLVTSSPLTAQAQRVATPALPAVVDTPQPSPEPTPQPSAEPEPTPTTSPSPSPEPTTDEGSEEPGTSESPDDGRESGVLDGPGRDEDPREADELPL